MVNGMLDFGDDDGLQGFIGGGIGVARVKADDYALNTRGAFLDDSDTVLAWQVLAGVRAPITDHLDVSLKYRFFNADNVKLVDVHGPSARDALSLAQHPWRPDLQLRRAGCSAAAAAAAAEPAPPPPPPPPPPVVCSPGPYIVFFDWDKSDIKPEAASILDEAIGKYQTCGNAQVMLAGHADKSGSATYNVGLSRASQRFGPGLPDRPRHSRLA